MKLRNNEILFKSHAEAMEHIDALKDHGAVIYNCSMCGIVFGSADPFTSEGGILCSVCVKTMNFSQDQNWRPEDDEFEPCYEFHRRNLAAEKRRL